MNGGMKPSPGLHRAHQVLIQGHDMGQQIWAVKRGTRSLHGHVGLLCCSGEKALWGEVTWHTAGDVTHGVTHASSRISY